MSMSSVNYLVPIEYLDSWWIRDNPTGPDCHCEVLMESNEDDQRTYRKVRFDRNEEVVVGTSLPGPKDRDDVFLVALKPSSQSSSFTSPTHQTLLKDIDFSLVELGAQCVSDASNYRNLRE